VRLLTNNYEGATCPDLIQPLDFLVLAGVQVRFYTSTTFMHAKFMIVDGKVVSISSVK
jgi:phosphatidylserine/phosphatidylglycerophosphate/cardiolipin synthase-like enzyme